MEFSWIYSLTLGILALYQEKKGKNKQASEPCRTGGGGRREKLLEKLSSSAALPDPVAINTNSAAGVSGGQHACSINVGCNPTRSRGLLSKFPYGAFTFPTYTQELKNLPYKKSIHWFS